MYFLILRVTYCDTVLWRVATVFRIALFIDLVRRRTLGKYFYLRYLIHYSFLTFQEFCFTLCTTLLRYFIFINVILEALFVEIYIQGHFRYAMRRWFVYHN